MSTVGTILEQKGHDVYSVTPDVMVLDALKLMADKNIGAVAVIAGGKLTGMFSERDYTRKVFLQGRASPSTPVRDVMETEVVYVEPDQSAEACMALVTEKRIRHLPVMRDGKLDGIVSIGDLMKSMIEEREFNIEQLVKYVQG